VRGRGTGAAVGPCLFYPPGGLPRPADRERASEKRARGARLCAADTPDPLPVAPPLDVCSAVTRLALVHTFVKGVDG
jgi:hypothetical protein